MKVLLASMMAFFMFSSCEDILFEEELASNSPMDNFEYLWQECNEKYSYFDLKDVDWDMIKKDYAGRVYKGMSEDSLFTVLADMLRELKDDHANLFSAFNTSFYGIEYLGQDNFDWRIIVDNYITPNYYLSGPFSHNFIEDGQIGYLRLSTFSLEITEENLDFILNRYKDTQGLILDIRENGGGAIANVFRILERFVEEETLVSYSRIKNGPGHTDFTEAKPVFVQPYEGIRYTKPIAILTDRGTYSSGSLLSLASKAIANIILIGDTTGGGLGMPNGGQLPNGWTYRFSVSQSLTLDKKADLEKGVPADIAVFIDWDNLERDEILERAIEELR